MSEQTNQTPENVDLPEFLKRKQEQEQKAKESQSDKGQKDNPKNNQG